jgi:SPP1 gp7 family putative phage head morphogenesis protein
MARPRKIRQRNKIKPMRYPIGQEIAYRRILLTYVGQYKKLLKKHMSPIVPLMVKEASNIHALPTGEVRQDAWQDELRDAFSKIAKDMGKPTETALKQMSAIGPRVNEYNKAEWKDLVRSQYGVNPTREDPDKYNGLLRQWSRDNALLIKDIPQKTSRQIAALTEEALRSGKTGPDMASDIFDIMSERTDVSDSRARLIARDQVSKLNGQFTEERQRDIGVEGYIWRTVGDERVRDEHEEVDGQFFTWDNPPDFGHPGEDIQCRCWPEPVLPERLAFEAELLEEAA